MVGPESAAKSTLASQIASHYQTIFLEEYARLYLSKKGSSSYSTKEVLAMQQGQIISEDNFLKTELEHYILDTDVLTYKVWFYHKYGISSHRTECRLRSQVTRYYLLCYPDIAWQGDKLREAPDILERKALFQLYLKYLKELNFDYTIIKGLGEERLVHCLAAINKN